VSVCIAHVTKRCEEREGVALWDMLLCVRCCITDVYYSRGLVRCLSLCVCGQEVVAEGGSSAADVIKPPSTITHVKQAYIYIYTIKLRI